jgi:hypothetical protein
MLRLSSSCSQDGARPLLLTRRSAALRLRRFDRHAFQALEWALRGEVSEWATATRTSSLLKAVAHWTEDTTNNDVSGVGFYMERARTCVRLAGEFKEFADKLAAAVGEILSNPLSVILLQLSLPCNNNLGANVLAWQEGGCRRGA